MGDSEAAGGSGLSRKTKTCFVTVGATAPFDGLIKAILQPQFLQSLHDAEYTELHVQHGYEGQDNLFSRLSRQPNVSEVCESCHLKLHGFGFDKDGLDHYMRGAKGVSARSSGADQAIEGAVISHAGSGSVLAALRIGVPLIVVPNDELLHGHQLELAVELAKQDYVVHGKLEDLPAAVTDVERLRLRTKQWPPVNSGEEKYKKGLSGVMDEEMGWVD